MIILKRLEEIKIMLSKSSISVEDYDKITKRIKEISDEFDISIVGISLSQVNDIIISYFKLRKDYHKRKTRIRDYVLARQFAMVFMYKYTKKTKQQIGVFFNKDHSTVIHADRAIRDLIETDKESLRQYSEIDNIIQIKHIT